ncbi:lytic polysaccharide monooxygenase auxiliary activity family 9 protein [Streptomyces sp. NPDC059161]|uniref:lytic polysaccharide monooxygenase auxiliary activity family 9 protein n=1 Tax=Streptomyces sp. NPDC059161 TaxID=3346749 RepID=UPI00367D7C26
MAALVVISPESRQAKYLTKAQAGTRGGKFITRPFGEVSDPDVPSDIVNRPPPQDGQIASAGNPFAAKLDGLVDEFGNPWRTTPVTSGRALAVVVQIDEPVKVRRVIAYITKPNWDPTRVLTRAQFDLGNPVHTRTYPAVPFQSANSPIPVGLVASKQLEFGFSLPTRPVGHHVLLVEFDLPDSGDAFYQVIDLRYTN